MTSRPCIAAIGLAASTFLLVVSPTAVAQSPADTALARAHFRRGLELVDERRFDAALAEFERAYRLRPAYQVLYNLGVVHDALEHTVEAVDAFEQYLREGGDRIAPARRAEVEATLTARRRLVARLVVRVNVDGAIVAVDGRDVGRSPLGAAIRLTAGAHVLSVTHPGHEPEQRALRLAGDIEETVAIDLRPVAPGRASLEIATRLAQVEIVVDGRVVGTTPLAGPIAVQSGRRVIDARRAGYRTHRRAIDLVEASTTRLEVALEPDPSAPASDVGALRLVLPRALHVVRVDGTAVRGSELQLPRGPHEVEVRVRGRRPLTARIDVPAGREVVLHPHLEWTADARIAELESAGSRRTLGWILTISGAALIGATIPMMIWNETRLDGELAAMDQRCTGTPEPAGCAAWREMHLDELEEYNAQVGSVDALRYVGIGAAIVGVAAVALGMERLLGAPGETEIDRRASAQATPRLRLGVGWGSLTVLTPL
ncbi:MAG: PEGA domain-containing protein [Deltaproteobacteria bacterium]|nr:PEGA domain-containing protein [Deltaproteobacteria bacterium]